MLQDNDVERETTINRDHLDYLAEESWRWLIACKSRVYFVVKWCSDMSFYVTVVIDSLQEAQAYKQRHSAITAAAVSACTVLRLKLHCLTSTLLWKLTPI